MHILLYKFRKGFLKSQVPTTWTKFFNLPAVESVQLPLRRQRKFHDRNEMMLMQTQSTQGHCY